MSFTPGMLIVLMSDFAGDPALHLRHKDPVVIDEAQLPVFDDDVAVLQIAMRDARSLQRVHQSKPLFGKMQQYFTAVQHLCDIQIESRPIDPVHEEDRKSIAADQNSFRSVTEFRKI